MQTVTLTNNGGVPLALASVTASGDYTLAVGSEYVRELAGSGWEFVRLE